jgi:phosphatidylcholine synthase
VAFYIYVLRMSPWLSLTLLLGLSFLTFVPTRYLYPSQRGRLNRMTNLLGAVWAGMLGWVVLRMSPEQTSSGVLDQGTYCIALLSLFFPLYYLATSWMLSLRFWLRRQHDHPEQ